MTLRKPRPGHTDRLPDRSGEVSDLSLVEEDLTRRMRMAIRAAMGRAKDMGTLESHAQVRALESELADARDELRRRGEKIQELQLALDGAQRPVRARRSVTQLQIPSEQEMLRERTRRKTSQEVTILKTRSDYPPQKKH